MKRGDSAYLSAGKRDWRNKQDMYRIILLLIGLLCPVSSIDAQELVTPPELDTTAEGAEEQQALDQEPPSEKQTQLPPEEQTSERISEELKEQSQEQEPEQEASQEEMERGEPEKDVRTLPSDTRQIRAIFDQGRNAYLYGSYQEAVSALKPLVDPEVLIADPDELALCFEYLGLAYFYLGNLEQAERFLVDLIYFRPDYRLDPVQVPPKAVTLYNQLRLKLQSEIQERQKALRRQELLDEERRLKKMRQQIVLERQVNQYLVAFIPFGVGQFQNRDQGLGYFFLASEVIAVGLSAGFFWGVEALRQADGRFLREDYTVAHRMQNAQVISGGVALGLMISGVVHALWRFKPYHDLGNYLDPEGEYQDEE